MTRMRTARRTAEAVTSVLFRSGCPGGADVHFLRAISAENSSLTVLLRSGDHYREAYGSVSAGRYRLFAPGEKDLGVNPDWSADMGADHRFPVRWSPLVRWEKDKGYDCKVPWELSRLQFLPSLIAHSLTGRSSDGLHLAERILRNWVAANPWNRGINWVSAMEIALRGLNILVYFAYASQRKHTDMDELSGIIWKHIHSINALELASPGALRHNHILVSSAAQVLLCCTIRSRETDRYLEKACRILKEEILHQFRPDGGHFESSINYHRFCLESVLFLFLVLQDAPLEGLPDCVRDLVDDMDVLERVSSALQLTEVYMKAMNKAPAIGDADDGRVFFYRDYFSWEPDDHGYISEMAAELRSLPAPSYKAGVSTALFRDSGLGFFQGRDYGLCCCSTPVDRVAGGHSHSDKCSFLLQIRGHSVLSDPGTGCYTPDAERRAVLRNGSSHNVFLADDKDILEFDKNRIFSRPGAVDTSIACVDEQNCFPRFDMGHTGYERLLDMGVFNRSITCEEGSLMIRDTLEGSGRHVYSIHYAFAPGISVVRGYRCLLVSGDGEDLCSIELPDNSSATIAESLFSSAYGVFSSTSHVEIKGELILPGTVSHRIIISS